MRAELGNIIETLTTHEATLTMELGNLSTQAKRVGEQLAVIQEIVTIVLAKHDRMPSDQLLNQVKSELLARGLSRVGAKPLLADAIKKPAFTINPDQTVSLK